VVLFVVGIGRGRWSGAGPGALVDCWRQLENVTYIHRYLLFKSQICTFI